MIEISEENLGIRVSGNGNMEKKRNLYFLLFFRDVGFKLKSFKPEIGDNPYINMTVRLVN